MQRIYYSIALLVLYGDLIKRVFEPTLALFTVYFIAVIILIGIFVKRKRIDFAVGIEGRWVFVFVSSLIGIYFIQLLTTFTPSFEHALSHTLYMCIPLLYVVIIMRYSPQFELVHLAKVFLILMVPINFVGFVQYFIQPDFLISTSYSGDLGGVIQRNFLAEGWFSRYPSLFASADRYSAMGLMQLFFVFVVYEGNNSSSKWWKIWLIFNLISAFSALFIAGARSRILIALVSFIFMGLSFVWTFFSRKIKQLQIHKMMASVLLGIIIVVLIPLSGMNGEDQEDSGNEMFPVLAMLMQSFETGDINKRVGEASEFSLMPEDVSWFGQGLGTVGAGKPGEFGIRSMWSESGLVWGSLMLFLFFGTLTVLLLTVWKSFLAREPMNVGIRIIPSMLLIFALLAGFTSSFELSSGLLLGCSIAVVTRASTRNKRSSNESACQFVGRLRV